MNRLKQARQESGLSLRKLATAAQVDQATISEIETDKRKAQPLTLSKLAAALNVEVQEFSDLLDKAASQRGRIGGQARTVKHKQVQAQDPTEAAPKPIRPTRHNQTPRRISPLRLDCWVFDNTSESYGPLSHQEAHKLQLRFNSLGVKARVFQGESFEKVSEQFRQFLMAEFKGREKWEGEKEKL